MNRCTSRLSSHCWNCSSTNKWFTIATIKLNSIDLLMGKNPDALMYFSLSKWWIFSLLWSIYTYIYYKKILNYTSHVRPNNKKYLHFYQYRQFVRTAPTNSCPWYNLTSFVYMYKKLNVIYFVNYSKYWSSNKPDDQIRWQPIPTICTDIMALQSVLL